jgi:hypothetical protein
MPRHALVVGSTRSRSARDEVPPMGGALVREQVEHTWKVPQGLRGDHALISLQTPSDQAFREPFSVATRPCVQPPGAISVRDTGAKPSYQAKVGAHHFQGIILLPKSIPQILPLAARNAAQASVQPGVRPGPAREHRRTVDRHMPYAPHARKDCGPATGGTAPLHARPHTCDEQKPKAGGSSELAEYRRWGRSRIHTHRTRRVRPPTTGLWLLAVLRGLGSSSEVPREQAVSACVRLHPERPNRQTQHRRAAFGPRSQPSPRRP